MLRVHVPALLLRFERHWLLLLVDDVEVVEPPECWIAQHPRGEAVGHDVDLLPATQRIEDGPDVLRCRSRVPRWAGIEEERGHLLSLLQRTRTGTPPRLPTTDVPLRPPLLRRLPTGELLAVCHSPSFSTAVP